MPNYILFTSDFDLAENVAALNRFQLSRKNSANKMNNKLMIFNITHMICHISQIWYDIMRITWWQRLSTKLTWYFSPENYRLVNSCNDYAWIEPIKLDLDWDTGQIPIAPKSTIATVVGDDLRKNLILCVFDGEFSSKIQSYSNRSRYF